MLKLVARYYNPADDVEYAAAVSEIYSISLSTGHKSIIINDTIELNFPGVRTIEELESIFVEIAKHSRDNQEINYSISNMDARITYRKINPDSKKSKTYISAILQDTDNCTYVTINNGMINSEASFKSNVHMVNIHQATVFFDQIVNRMRKSNHV